jgi:hypothetical protein
VAETPEDLKYELIELESAATLAFMDYKESVDPTSNVVSIAPGSPARRMWETRMALIKFIWEHGVVEEETDI